MSYKIQLTDNFLRELKPFVKKYHGLGNDLEKLKTSFLKHPIQGDPLGLDCFKVRMAISAKNKGKSGGARIIVCVKIYYKKIFLISIFDKSEKENISPKRLVQMLREAGLDKL